MAFIFLSNSAPITANAATVKKVGVGKSFTYNAKATVKSVKVSKKGIVKATKKGKKVTVKGVKAGTTTVTVKTAKKTIKLNVKVGATKIAKKTLKSTMTAGTSQTVSVTATAGKGDTIKFASSNKAVLTVNKASAKASTKGIAKMGVKAVKEGTAKLTVSSKNTGVKKAFTIKVVAAAPAPTQAPSVATTPAITTPSATPGVATTPAVTATAPAGTDAAPSQNPNATKDPNETQDPNATKNPDATKDPNATTNPDATKDPNATTNPDATEVPSVSTNPAVTASPSAVEFTAKQTGDKKITVTNPTAMTKDSIVVKRGNSTVTIDKVDIDELGTTAVVTLAGSIVATEYTVTIGEASKTITGEASMVKDIQITSSEVSMDGQIGSSSKGYANYAVYNQFGENITAKTSLVANTSAKAVSLNPTEGTMEISWNTDSKPRLNDMVSVVLMYQNSGVSTSKMLKVATQAAPAEIEVTGVYNTDGKKLAATNINKNDFYFLFRVKDQYGNYMTSGNIHTSDSPAGTPEADAYKQNMFCNVSSGMTNIKLDDTLQTITVDGENYLGYLIKQDDEDTAVVAGTVTVMLIPGGSGKTITSEIVVGKGNTVDTLTISVPGSLPSGSTMDLEYVALDENGEDVTDYRVLKEVTPSSNKFSWIKENGKVVLRCNDTTKPTNPGSSISNVFTLPNYETKLVTINVVDSKKAASISGIDSDVSRATRTGDDVTIDVSKLKIQDQYGNEFSQDAQVKEDDVVRDVFLDKDAAAANATTDKNKLAIMVVEEDENNDIFAYDTTHEDYALATYDNGTVEKDAYILGTDEAFAFKGDVKLMGTKNYTFKLVQFNGTKWVNYETTSYTGATTNNTQVGAFTTTVTNTENKRFVSYKVEGAEKMWLNAGKEDYDTDVDGTGKYTPGVTVKGVLSNGQTVTLKTSDYKLVAGENIKLNTDDASKIMANVGDYFDDNKNATKVTGKYDVVINYTGETINKTVEIYKSNPTTAKIEFATSGQKGINVNLSTQTLNVATMVAQLKAKDNFGVDAPSAFATAEYVTLLGKDNTNAIKDKLIVTVTDIDTIKGEVENNGTTLPTFTGFEAGDSFTVTFTAGEASFSTTVSVQGSVATTPVDPEEPETRTVSSYSTSNSEDITVAATGNATKDSTSSDDALALLPTSAYAKLSDGSYVAVSLSWDWSDGVTYDNTTVDDYEATATVTGLPAGIAPIALTANVTVAEAETRTVSSYSTSNSEDITVAATSNATKDSTSSDDALALLPTSAYAKLSDGSYVAVSLSWDWSNGVTYDNTTAAAYEATATVTGLPTGITPTTLTADVTVA